ncbi:FAD-binding domain-containing protein [Apiospora sp. TS-2023a]
MFFRKATQPPTTSPPPPPKWAEAVRKSLAEELLGGSSGRSSDDLLFFPGSPEFADSETGYLTAQANEVRSAAVARPTSTAEVSALVQALKRSLPPSVTVAIRGGGHATFAGAAKAAGGVTVDMRGVRGIEILDEGRRVRIAAGHRWNDVYAALEGHDPPLTTAGGRAGQVGRGFGADLVRAWEVVLASGRVVRASATGSSDEDEEDNDEETNDLWDALRGGSTNFGIVTAVEMECFPHPEHFRGAYMFYLTPARQATLEALVKVSQRPSHAADGPTEQPVVVDHVIWSITHVPYVPFKIIAVSSSSTGAVGQDNLSGFVAPWSRIPGTPTPRELTHGAYAKEVGDLGEKEGTRISYKSVSVKLDLDLLNTVIDMWYALRHRSVVRRPAAGNNNNSNNTAEADANFFGLRPEDGPLVIVEICHNWRRAADDAEAYAAVDAFLRDVDRVASERGLGSRWVFPNYAQPDEKVMQAYGPERLAQLKRVAERWDPDGFFQKRVVGGFKIEEK